jgi:hypothetical protein
MNIAIVCTALIGLLLFALGFYVSILRGRFRRGIGHDLSLPTRSTARCGRTPTPPNTPRSSR